MRSCTARFAGPSRSRSGLRHKLHVLQHSRIRSRCLVRILPRPAPHGFRDGRAGHRTGIARETVRLRSGVSEALQAMLHARLKAPARQPAGLLPRPGSRESAHRNAWQVEEMGGLRSCRLARPGPAWHPTLRVRPSDPCLPAPPATTPAPAWTSS
jgi:hypothetical protein